MEAALWLALRNDGEAKNERAWHISNLASAVSVHKFLSMPHYKTPPTIPKGVLPNTAVEIRPAI
jgi:hypothetical protein